MRERKTALREKLRKAWISSLIKHHIIVMSIDPGPLSKHEPGKDLTPLPLNKIREGEQYEIEQTRQSRRQVSRSEG